MIFYNFFNSKLLFGGICSSSDSKFNIFFYSILPFKHLLFYYIQIAHWLVGRVFANGPGDLGSIPGRVIPKTFKMVLDTSLLNTQQYKIRIKGKVEKSREKSSALPGDLVQSQVALYQRLLKWYKILLC